VYSCGFLFLALALPPIAVFSCFARARPLARALFPHEFWFRPRPATLLACLVLLSFWDIWPQASAFAHQGRPPRSLALHICFATAGLVVERFRQLQRQHLIYLPGKNLPLHQWQFRSGGEVLEPWINASIFSSMQNGTRPLRFSPHYRPHLCGSNSLSDPEDWKLPLPCRNRVVIPGSGEWTINWLATTHMEPCPILLSCNCLLRHPDRGLEPRLSMYKCCMSERMLQYLRSAPTALPTPIPY
jgi:hypothetical protein